MKMLKFTQCINTIITPKIRGGKATRLKYKEAQSHEKVSNM
jgi:hypothetical protein